MKCFICNGYHSFGESCPGDSSNNLLSNLRIPSYEPPPLIEFNKPKFEPILPSYEPPPLIEFNKPRFEPILPSYEPPKPFMPSYEPLPLIEFNKPRFEPILPSFEPPTFELPKPIIPSYEPPPLIEFNKPSFQPILPSYEPPKPTFDFLSRPEPLIPPPSPVYNINHDLIGYKPEFDNHINVGFGGNGTRLEIDPGGFVRDPIGNLVGQMGPLNTIMPPSLPSMPDYGPPQSTPDAWNPGFSPMKPFG